MGIGEKPAYTSLGVKGLLDLFIGLAAWMVPVSSLAIFFLLALAFVTVSWFLGREVEKRINNKILAAIFSLSIVIFASALMFYSEKERFYTEEKGSFVDFASTLHSSYPTRDSENPAFFKTMGNNAHIIVNGGSMRGAPAIEDNGSDTKAEFNRVPMSQ